LGGIHTCPFNLVAATVLAHRGRAFTITRKTHADAVFAFVIDGAEFAIVAFLAGVGWGIFAHAFDAAIRGAGISIKAVGGFLARPAASILHVDLSITVVI
jgi:hypothetical protein